MANGDSGGALSALPPWARALIEIVFRHGVSAALALFAVYFLGSVLIQRIDRVEARVEMHAESSNLVADIVRRQEGTTQAIVAVLQQLCINTANDDNERRACVRAAN